MSEIKKCKHCQSEIDKKAKVCPVCRKKQGGKAKTIVIVLIVLFIIGVLASITDNSSSDNDNSKSSTKQANGDTKETNNSDNKDTDKSIKFGDEAKSDDLVLKVNKVGDSAEIIENDFLSYTPDSGKYAIINVTIKNDGKKSVSLTNGYFKLITSDESEYTPTILIGLSNKYISFESINPGLDVTGNLVFEVPTDLDISGATLQFSGTGLFSAATDFKLK